MLIMSSNVKALSRLDIRMRYGRIEVLEGRIELYGVSLVNNIDAWDSSLSQHISYWPGFNSVLSDHIGHSGRNSASAIPNWERWLHPRR